MAQLHEAPLDWFGLLMKEATIATSRYFTLADFQLGIELLAARQVDVSGLIQDEAAFENLFAKADENGGPFTIRLIRYGDSTGAASVRVTFIRLCTASDCPTGTTMIPPTRI